MNWGPLVTGLALIPFGVAGLVRRESAWIEKGGSRSSAQAIGGVIVVFGLVLVGVGIFK
jgi:hypothetical protein